MSNADQVLDFLLTHDKKLYRAVLSDFKDISGAINTDDLQELLENGLYDEALNLIKDMTDKNTSAFPIALTAAFIAGGTLFSGFMGTTFDALNPTINSLYGRYKVALVEDLGNQIKRTSGDIITLMVSRGTTPEEMAMELKRSVGLTITQWQAVQKYKEALEKGSISALRRELRDKGMDDIVADLFADHKKLSEAQINRLTSSYMEAYKKLRAQTIATTEATRLYSIAQVSLINKMIEDGEFERTEVRKFWVHMNDGKVRNSHIQIPRMNKAGVELGKRFETPLGTLEYPGDPSGVAADVINCRCHLEFKIVKIE